MGRSRLGASGSGVVGRVVLNWLQAGWGEYGVHDDAHTGPPCGIRCGSTWLAWVGVDSSCWQLLAVVVVRCWTVGLVEFL